jgi:hypothetical protein
MNKMTVTHVIPAQAERFALYVMLHTNLLLIECYFYMLHFVEYYSIIGKAILDTGEHMSSQKWQRRE